MNLEKALELCIAGREDITKSLELEKLIKQAIREDLAQKKGEAQKRKG